MQPHMPESLKHETISALPTFFICKSRMTTRTYWTSTSNPSLYGGFLPATSNTQHVNQASDLQSTLRHLMVINFPSTCCAFPTSSYHRSPSIVSSNYDSDDPSHLVNISPLENQTCGCRNQFCDQITVKASQYKAGDDLLTACSWQQNDTTQCTVFFLLSALATLPLTLGLPAQLAGIRTAVTQEIKVYGHCMFRSAFAWKLTGEKKKIQEIHK